MKRLFYVLIPVLLAFSCTREEKVTIEDLRQREIDRRIDQFIENKEIECYTNTMDRAISIADSLLKINAVKYVEDSLRRPALPSKPELILRPAPKDSIKPRPFIQPPPKDSITPPPPIDLDTLQ